MIGLTEFLLARIAEDEAAHQACANVTVPDCPVIHISGSGGRGGQYRPFRALAECEAKRRIVELHGVLSWTMDRNPRCETCADNENADYDGAPLIDWPCPTLRLLALPYAEHPDYREEWRP